MASFPHQFATTALAAGESKAACCGAGAEREEVTAPRGNCLPGAESAAIPLRPVSRVASDVGLITGQIFLGSPQEFVKTFKYRWFSEIAFLDTLSS
jgi:hypothetical protein